MCLVYDIKHLQGKRVWRFLILPDRRGLETRRYHAKLTNDTPRPGISTSSRFGGGSRQVHTRKAARVWDMDGVPWNFWIVPDLTARCLQAPCDLGSSCSVSTFDAWTARWFDGMWLDEWKPWNLVGGGKQSDVSNWACCYVWFLFYPEGGFFLSLTPGWRTWKRSTPAPHFRKEWWQRLC